MAVELTTVPVETAIDVADELYFNDVSETPDALNRITAANLFGANLSAIKALTSAADKGIQFTGSGTAAVYDLTAAGKALLDDANAAAQRTTLGVGTGDSPQFTSLTLSNTLTVQTGAGESKIESDDVTLGPAAKSFLNIRDNALNQWHAHPNPLTLDTANKLSLGDGPGFGNNTCIEIDDDADGSGVAGQIAIHCHIANGIIIGDALGLGNGTTLTVDDVSQIIAATKDITVPDEAYDATAWNGSLEVPTKNAIRDKIETMGGGGMAIGGAITSATAGSVLFADASGQLGQDNAALFWDITNDRLGIGINASLAGRLHVVGGTTITAQALTQGSANNGTDKLFEWKTSDGTTRMSSYFDGNNSLVWAATSGQYRFTDGPGNQPLEVSTNAYSTTTPAVMCRQVVSTKPALGVDAHIEMVEQTAPSAPAANKCHLYVEDNGSGKSRLMALFASGAAQQVAIEP